MFVASLPVPPTANNLFPTGRSGKRFPSSQYKNWKALAALEFQGCSETLTGRLKAIYRYEFADERKRDLANFEKALTDFLVSNEVMLDDSQIDEMVLLRLPKAKEPRVYINIFTIPGE